MQVNASLTARFARKTTFHFISARSFVRSFAHLDPDYLHTHPFHLDLLRQVGRDKENKLNRIAQVELPQIVAGGDAVDGGGHYFHFGFHKGGDGMSELGGLSHCTERSEVHF